MSRIQFFIKSMENISSQNYFSHFNCDGILGTWFVHIFSLTSESKIHLLCHDSIIHSYHAL